MSFRRIVLVSIAGVLAIGCGISYLRASQDEKRITLHVAVFDSHNQPVGDLKSEEFQITDQNKPQRIVSFRRNGDQPQLNAPKESEAHGASNSSSPLIVIIFDLLNANMANRNLAQEEMVQVLEPLESSDSVFLYLLTNAGTLYPIHPMPDGPLGASSSGTPWTRQIRPLMKDAIDKVSNMRPADEREVFLRVSSTYKALDLVASKMKLNLGWKNLVWITHGIPLVFPGPTGSAIDGSNNLQRFATGLDQYDISVSVVERGNDPGAPDTAMIQTLTQLTGGTIYDSNLEKVMSEIQGAVRSGYVIQYDASAADGKYHKIRVSTSRKGLRIQTKQGYYATR
jgi:VWFA-related protein